MNKVNRIETSETDEDEEKPTTSRRSTRVATRTKSFQDEKSSVARPVRASRRVLPSSISISSDDGEIRSHLSKDEESDTDVDGDGKKMFGFNTPKKSHPIKSAPIPMNTPKTPKTPTTGSKTLNVPKTPYTLRKKVKTQIAQMLDDSNSDFSRDESEFTPSECTDETESESDDTNNEQTPKTVESKPVGTVPNIQSIATKTKRERQMKGFIPDSDGYFASHSSSKVLTSDNTLNRLKTPRLQADKIFKLLADLEINPEHEKAITRLMNEYESYFPKWMYTLNEGFNIILYGLGSKRTVLQKFQTTMLTDYMVLVVNGFFPSLTLKEILDSITVDILEIGSSPANPNEAVKLIENQMMENCEMHIYLIIHNIEGTMLRNEKAQETLSSLAKIPNIHLLASVDHINAPLLWDNNKLRNYNFIWWDCTTMLPYTQEIAFENSLLIQNSGELALSSMRNVFLSLTTNSRGIYMLIVKYQLKHGTNPNYQGMAFKDLYWSCREAFLVSSDIALRAQLTEFLDHKLVKTKRSVDGSELLQIPIESSFLQQFVEEQEQKSVK